MGTSKIFFKKYIVTKSYPQVITKKGCLFCSYEKTYPHTEDNFIIIIHIWFLDLKR